MTELSPQDTRTTRPELLAILAHWKMDRLEDEREGQLAITGQQFESLPLSGDLTLRREVTGGTQGNPIKMTYQTGNLSGTSAWYETITTTPEGRVVYEYDAYGHSKGERLSGFRRAIIAIKLLKGRPDHWDKESDFYGSCEED